MFEAMKVKGKVALIIGGTSGLGKAFAKALLDAKTSVVSFFLSCLMHGLAIFST